ncbi:hypothetical protein SDJN02_06552, partial [Cucurbita argyrosperma subsp. argyrosperma]
MEGSGPLALGEAFIRGSGSVASLEMRTAYIGDGSFMKDPMLLGVMEEIGGEANMMAPANQAESEIKIPRNEEIAGCDEGRMR